MMAARVAVHAVRRDDTAVAPRSASLPCASPQRAFNGRDWAYKVLPAKGLSIIEAVEASVAEGADPEPLTTGPLRAEQAIVVTSDSAVKYMAVFSAHASQAAGLVSIPSPTRRTSAPPLVFIRRPLPSRKPPPQDRTRHGTSNDTSMVGAFATPRPTTDRRGPGRGNVGAGGAGGGAGAGGHRMHPGVMRHGSGRLAAPVEANVCAVPVRGHPTGATHDGGDGAADGAGAGAVATDGADYGYWGSLADAGRSLMRHALG